MASTYTDLGTELMTTGENAGNWGTKTNVNLQILEEAVRGYVAISANSDQTLSLTDGSTGDSIRNAVIAFTGTLSANRTITVPALEKWWIMDNQTAGAYTLTVKVSGQTGITWGASDKGTKILYGNGTDVVDTNVGGGVGGYDLNGEELILDADANTSITADTDNQIDIKIAGADDFTMTANAFNVLTGSHVTFADSANAKFGTGNDMLLYHDGSNSYITNAQGALKIATETSGIAVTIGHTTSETTIADNLTVTGTLTGTLATAAQGSVTSLGTLTTLTVDNIIVNGTTIGHTSDTDLLTLTSGVATVAGELDATTLDISGNADIDGTTNLDAVDIDGAVQLDSTFTVGVDDTGYDVKFFGDTASAYMMWDTSADDLVLAGAAGIDLAGDIDVDGTANLDNTDIDGTLAVDGTTISLDATTSLNIDNSNTTNGITIGTATSGVPISIGHATSEVTINDNLTVTGTLTLGSNAELTEAELEFLDGITAGTAAASKAMVADANIDITGGRNITISGELDAATLDISGNADIDGTTNLDAVDIDGAVQLDSTFTVGVDDTGYDVKFFGATSGAYMLWDESTDDLVLAGAAKLYLYDAAGGEYLSSSGSALTIASGSAAWELPASDGSANQVLKTDGSGNLDWTSITSATVTALNNATANELVTVGATTTELDAEANLTFDGTDMLIGGAGKLQLRDTAIFINSSTDGQLDIDADTEVEITATTVDLNGILDVSGVLVAGGQISASDGTAGAPSISNTGDLNTGLLFSAADTMQFSSGGTAQFTMADGAITPVTDNDIDLGSNSLQFKNLYVNGTTFTDALGFGTTVMTLPTADGDADQILKTDGSGNIGFATSSGIGMGKAIAAALVFG